jgi:hypothetical protein
MGPAPSPTGAPSQRRSLGLALGAFPLLGLLLLAGAFPDFERLGGKDWDQFFAQAQADVTTLRDHGQLPLWNPWRRGGQVSLGQPGSLLLSPVTPLALLVGVVPAFKLLLLPLFLAGCSGMWALAAELGLRSGARLVPGLVFFGSSIFPLYVCGGLPNWLFGMAILPWLFLAHRRAAASHRWVLGAALLYAALLFCGGVQFFVFYPLLLLLDAALLSLARRSPRPLGATVAVLLVGACLASIRLVPLLEVYRAFPRELAPGHQGCSLSLSLAIRALLGSDLPDLSTRAGPWVIAPGEARVYWINAGSYVGPLALALAGIGAARLRRTSGLLLVAVAFLWMSLGANASPSLWEALRQLPVLASMRGPARMMLLVCFALALLAGFGFERVERWLSARVSPGWQRAIAAWLLLATAAPMVAVNAPIARHAFAVEPTPGLRSGGLFADRAPPPPFQQTGVRRNRAQFSGPVYEGVLRNHGNVFGQSDIPSFAAVAPAGAPGYRGEVYLLNGRGRVSADVTPNLIRARADLAERDLLVVNQAWFPGWKVEGGAAGPAGPSPAGLLSVALEPGRHVLSLRYRPRHVGVGAAASALALGLAAAALRSRAGGRGARPDPVGRREWTALLGYALLAAGIGLYAGLGPAD